MKTFLDRFARKTSIQNPIYAEFSSRLVRFAATTAIACFIMVLTFVVVPVQVAEAGSVCVGYGANGDGIGLAKENYKRGCGQRWDANSGRHRCDWRRGTGWSCSGPRTPNQTCPSYFNRNINVAKRVYGNLCGQRWDPNSGFHRCFYRERFSDWTCVGPSSR